MITKHPFHRTPQCLLLLSIILLSACHHKQTHTHRSSNWQQVSSWGIKGKMAIRNGQDSGSGRISWQVNNNITQAQFKAPLGQGSWEITEDPYQATLISSREGQKTGATAQQLISQELGWNFPWEQLTLWLRGVKSVEQLTQQRAIPESFMDQGWNIIFDKWQETSVGSLPKKITATKPPYSVKLIIYSWDIN